jgi:hypothetical protein
MSGSLNSLYNSWLYLLLHVPFSYTGPKIYLKILLSKAGLITGVNKPIESVVQKRDHACISFDSGLYSHKLIL